MLFLLALVFFPSTILYIYYQYYKITPETRERILHPKISWSSIQRVSITGSTANGKSTLAQTISKKFQIPWIELDALKHLPNWEQSSKERMQQSLLEQFTIHGDKFVTDGNYSEVRPMIQQRAQIILWLDYNYWIIFYRLFKRTLYRVWYKQRLWNGNTETWKNSFASSNSLFVWQIQNLRKKRREFCAEFASKNYIRLRSPKETEFLLQVWKNHLACKN